jgi:hypothetical protein
MNNKPIRRFLRYVLSASLLLALIALNLLVTATPAAAAAETLVEQLSVNSTQTTPSYSTSTLTSGVTYRIEVSGFYVFACCGGQADAEYTTYDGFATHGDPGTPGANDLLVVYGSSIGVSVFNAAQNLTAQDVTWGPFDSTHIYSLEVVGDGGTIGFVVSDHWGGDGGSCSFNGCLFDNSGTLTVKIFEVTNNYNFNGFFQPVDNLPTLNVVKAGQAVPVKFSLNGDQGLNIFAADYPRSQNIECDLTTVVDGIEVTVTAGSSSLSYDPSTDTYTYVWKTDKAWANKCRQLVVKLNDGTEHVAYFRFK